MARKRLRSPELIRGFFFIFIFCHSGLPYIVIPGRDPESRTVKPNVILFGLFIFLDSGSEAGMTKKVVWNDKKRGSE